VGRRRRKAKAGKWVGRVLSALLALPALYLVTALIGSLVPVNRTWSEPAEGVTVYIADNGVHTDIVMPVRAEGLDWSRLLSRADAADAPADARWIAFGVGERAVYLDTPRWRDLRLPVAARALTRGERIVHVEWVQSPRYATRELRLRPEEYRRLWAAVRASFRNARPQRIARKGYGPADAFYEGVGHANAIGTCNQWTATRLRLAGVKTSLWSPFADGLVWRYRRNQLTSTRRPSARPA
jgi:uncharacterized protein (TIGR02117 family)